MALVEVKVPDIGDISEVAVIELMVKPGDTVKAEQSLITVESDKASMEIPSSTAGVVKELRVKLGDKVSEGSVVLVLEAEGSAESAAPAAPAAQAASSAPAAQAAAPAPVAAPAVAATSGPVEIRIPDIGDFKDVAVIEVLVKPGDTVKVEQSLVTVESDKASMEIPSSVAGVVKELKVKLGDKLNIGDLLLVLEGAASTGAVSAAPAPSPAAGEGVSSRPRVPAKPRTTQPSHPLVCPTPAPACASSRVSSAFPWKKSRAAASKAALHRKTFKVSPKP